MDTVTQKDAAAIMPEERPLPHPRQDLRSPYPRVPLDSAAKGHAGFWRAVTFLPAVATTIGMIVLFNRWTAQDGFIWLEIALGVLIALTFFWIALSLAQVTVGIFRRGVERSAIEGRPVTPLDIALVVPIYEEDPASVFGNLSAMIDALEMRPTAHGWSVYVLSDTRDADAAAAELRAVRSLGHDRVFYRRRAENTDSKVGNLADWITRWGGRHDAMIVLDADSLMGAGAIFGLADEMVRDPRSGLIQSFPRLFGAETLFGRMQQFASCVYGAPLAEGLAAWTDSEGNYWGHNAIIRVAAFAASAGLPRTHNGGLILSHDFVEAGLLRRAGWSVRFMPRIGESYEEVPQTLVDYAVRDRRWCRGNLQHLRLLGAKGFTRASRFHLFQGAMAYLMSAAWFLLLVAWSLVGAGRDGSVVSYFSGNNPQVNWPAANGTEDIAFLVCLYAMLLAPKAMAALALRQTGRTFRDMGGPLRYSFSIVVEIVASVAYAPIMMVQQTMAICRSITGRGKAWSPQRRGGGNYSWGALIKFHAVETVVGWALLTGMAAGLISLWLLPIAVSLALAVPLSRLSGMKVGRFGFDGLLGTEEQFNLPPLIQAARLRRAEMKAALAAE